MKEHDEMECVGLEMRGGLSPEIKYPAKYMHAPKYCYPEKNSNGGEAVDGAKIMGQVLSAK